MSRLKPYMASLSIKVMRRRIVVPGRQQILQPMRTARDRCLVPVSRSLLPPGVKSDMIRHAAGSRLRAVVAPFMGSVTRTPALSAWLPAKFSFRVPPWCVYPTPAAILGWLFLHQRQLRFRHCTPPGCRLASKNLVGNQRECVPTECTSIFPASRRVTVSRSSLSQFQRDACPYALLLFCCGCRF